MDTAGSAAAVEGAATSSGSTEGSSDGVMTAPSMASAASTFFVVRRVRFGFAVEESAGTSATCSSTMVGSSAATSAVAFRVRRLGFSVAGSIAGAAAAGSAALRVRRLGVSETDAMVDPGSSSAAVITVGSATVLLVERRFLFGAACSSVGCVVRVGIDGTCSGKTDSPSVRQIAASS